MKKKKKKKRHWKKILVWQETEWKGDLVGRWVTAVLEVGM
jgi:hypothetical protein